MQIIFVLKPSLFPLGQIVSTSGALTALKEADHLPIEFLNRHAKGDWGDLCAADRQENERSLREGFRLFSSYTLRNAQKLCTITEHAKSTTTLLLPLEY